MIYKAGKLIGVEIEQFAGVADQLASAAKDTTLRTIHQVEQAAQHVNHVANELASTNARIQANSNTILGARESLTHVGSAFWTRASRIMSRKLKVSAMRAIDI